MRDLTKTIDIEEARRFLQLLDPNAKAFTFQTFDSDRRDPFLAKIRHGSLDQHAAFLCEMNERGAAVSVTINETNLAGRRADDIQRVRAVWSDDDTGDGDTFPLRQSIVVETSPKHYHRYWLLEDHLDPEGFRSIMQVMHEQHGCDGNAKDISRAMRLPGFIGKRGSMVQIHLQQQRPTYRSTSPSCGPKRTLAA